jgi:Holliday junction resolvasome RuvABC ATP-dependent DNA helicase subunit
MLDTYVGQRDALAPLLAAITASRETGRPLPHMLFLGGPGRGKTTLAKAVADETGQHMVVLYGSSVLDRAEVGQKILDAKGGTLFIDEVHALPRQLSEELYRVIDDGKVAVARPVMKQVEKMVTVWIDDIVQLPEYMQWMWNHVGEGLYTIPTTTEKPTRESVTELMDVSPITIIGATTDEALLPQPFCSRLSALTVRLRAYDVAELMDIAFNHARYLGMNLDWMAAKTIAERSRGIPRRVKQLTERAADFTMAYDKRTISGHWVIDAGVKMALDAMGIDRYGLEQPHRSILHHLARNERGMSRTTLAQSVGIPMRNLDTYWGDLVGLGLVRISTRHEITEEGRKAL